MFNFFKPKPKPEPKTCLGMFDCKPYNFFEPGFIYAKDELVEQTESYKIYARIFKTSLLMFVLIEDENNVDMAYFNVHSLESKLKELFNDKYNSSVCLIIFKNQNEKTISLAKRPQINTKKEFNQIFVYNNAKVQLDFYRPVPSFYKLHDEYLEAVYYDLSCIDHDR